MNEETQDERKQNIKRLETALLGYIESETKKPSEASRVEVIPQMAHELIELWRTYP